MVTPSADASRSHSNVDSFCRPFNFLFREDRSHVSLLRSRSSATDQPFSRRAERSCSAKLFTVSRCTVHTVQRQVRCALCTLPSS